VAHLLPGEDFKPTEKQSFLDAQSQFMDEQDKPINPNELADQYPVLWQIFGPIAQKNQSLILNPDPALELQKSEVDRNPSLIKYIKNPPLEVQAIAVMRDPSAIHYIQRPDPALNKHVDGIKRRLEREERDKKKQEQFERWIRNYKENIMQAATPQELDYFVNEIGEHTVLNPRDHKLLNQLIQLQRLRLSNNLTTDDVSKAVQAGVIDSEQASHFKKYPNAASLRPRTIVRGPRTRDY
jgi:hypothetical protein